jgi:hypothetical protein
MGAFPNLIEETTTTIANGQGSSLAVDLYGVALVGISIPAAFTGIALTFQVSVDNGQTYQPMYKADGTAYSVTVAAGHYIQIPALDFAGIRFLKVISGSNEAADRVLTLVARPVR